MDLARAIGIVTKAKAAKMRPRVSKVRARIIHNASEAPVWRRMREWLRRHNQSAINPAESFAKGPCPTVRLPLDALAEAQAVFDFVAEAAVEFDHGVVGRAHL